MGQRWVAAAWLVLMMVTGTAAQPSLSGFVALDVQGFLRPPALPQQDSRQALPSLLLQPEFYYDWSNGTNRLTVVPMARLAVSDDDRRQRFDLREFNWLRAAPTWDLLVGVGKVFWGVTEARHLVDVINQTDLVEDSDGEARLGQPMLRLSWAPDWGTLTFFALPYFRERTFPGEKGRLRAELVVDTDNAQFESSLKEWHPDVAARWSHALGDWDVALGYFNGTSREPRLTPDRGDNGASRLIPVYDQIDQASLELQWTVEAWLWKLEAIARWGHDEHFSAAVAGFEYTFFNLFGTAFDLGVLAEYLYDGRSAAAPGTPFANDVFAGARLAFDDVGSTSILAGAIVDDESGATLATIEASRRLGNRWTIELEARTFLNVPSTALLYSMRRDDYVQLRLSRFF